MTATAPRALGRLVLALAVLAALAATLPGLARAKITQPTNAYFVAGGTSPVKGMNVTGFAGKNVLVSLSTSVGTLKIDGPCLSTYITPAFGYTTQGSELLFSGPYECVRQVMDGLTLTTPQPAQKVTKPGVATTPVTIKGMATEYRADLTYFAKTQHFYKFVPASVPWSTPSGVNAFSTRQTATTGANALAQASTELGLTGYLASITSAEENDFVATKIAGSDGYVVKNVWIGGSDLTTEGVWTWSGGPENGVQFWQGVDTGAVTNGLYAKWATGEPNNCLWNSSANRCDVTTNHAEDCAVINRYSRSTDIVTGTWNDLECTYTGTGQFGINGYVVEYGNKATGGDFANVFLTEKTISRQLPVTNVTRPNVLENLFKTLFVSKKAKKLPKKKNKPATFTVRLKVKMNEAGTYSVTVKRPDGKGIPFAFQPGSSYPLNGKTTKTTTELWNLIITTKKDNQTVTIKPILKNADWVKPKDTKLFFRLIASKKNLENQMCMTNWCQGQKIPVVKG